MPAKFAPRLLKGIVGMNNYDDSTSLQPGIVRIAQNMIPNKTSLDTRNGWAKYNTGAMAGSTANSSTWAVPGRP